MTKFVYFHLKKKSKILQDIILESCKFWIVKYNSYKILKENNKTRNKMAKCILDY